MFTNKSSTDEILRFVYKAMPMIPQGAPALLFHVIRLLFENDNKFDKVY